MALQSLEGAGVWVPDVRDYHSLGNSTFLIDATGEKAVLVLRCPKAGTLDRFDFRVGAVANSPDNGLRASFQGVSLTTGQNDGVILGSTNNAFVTYTHTVTTGWKSTNFGETVTVTRGQLIACVVDIPTFTASDSIALSSLAWADLIKFPYGINATSTKTSSLPIIALHYTDGYAFIAPEVPAIDAITTTSFFDVSTSPDEWGLAFQVPWPCKLNQIFVVMSVAAGSDYEVVVYNNADVVLATMAYDGDVAGDAGLRYHRCYLESELTLLKDSLYRVTIRPTTTNQINMQYVTFQSAALMHTTEGGDNFYMTSRVNQAGAWTDYNAGTFRRPRISLHFTAFDDAVSAGGGVQGSRIFSGY